MKTVTSISIDTTTFERFKTLVGPRGISSTIQNMMEARLNATDPVKSIDLEIAKIKLEETEKKLAEVGAEAAALKEQVTEAELAAKEAELTELEAEQARLKAEGSCVQCRQALGLKPVPVRSGMMCLSCFRSLPAHVLKDMV